jgi:LysM repeat protein
MLFGLFFVPFPAKASGFLDYVFGNQVSAANTTDPSNSDQNPKNSQTMTLLQANVSSAPILQDKNSKDTSSEIKSNTDVNISGNALSPATSHVGIPDSLDTGDSPTDQISVYVVRKGDSITWIAQTYGVSVNTIYWANDMKKGDKLVEGDTLFILPVSGVKATVVKGDTLKSIAKKYNVDVSDIAGYNGISENAKLAVGDELIIPDGEMADEGSAVSVPKTNSGNYIRTPIAYIPGYFINPVPDYKYRSQGLHDHGEAIDLAANKGASILASAAGTVIFARNSGYNGGYGRMVIIDHPNGTRTLYGHMSKVIAHTGDEVSQGELIGLVGNTGHSTGPHLHFRIMGARNPGGTTPMSWAN